ncbi:NAD-dependent succinate-semialdehyde dehydrogenase [Vibrio sp. 10N.261.55.A7]|uniref:NAD-dependent succinate-semialdehyde dehydrogenase n=1 Tax=Vibrio sp. 10N.261.55.A7 TaxID=1880851 RepID=UPI000C86782C|nr:NAD-dependent succinate-semialdehyde dehydrogenase [Vibrio sp. 10N.261.55.A7]PMJ99979.1 succinate-semialdehyde dehydrogenase (NADP(+)) [Vibrio sp. 10N.261.55.A7]
MINLKDQSLLKDKNYIDGSWVDGKKKITVANPSTSDVITEIACATSEEANSAVEAAHVAFKSWSKTTAKERSIVIKRWFNLIMDHSDDLGTLMTAEQGKPHSEAVAEVEYGAAFVEYYAEEAKRVMGSTIPTVANNRRLQTYKQAIGVVACITPWNFPSAMITRKVAPAIAAGCTVVIKPATETPLSALALCELAERAGIPAGVINVIASSSSREIGKVLTTHPKVSKFTFTGSTSVGKKLMEQCASTVKKVGLELGGNAPFIVFDDADLEAAVADCISTKFRNCGQTCVCTNRIYLQRNIAIKFEEMLLEGIKNIQVGDGLKPNTTMGPLINKTAVNDMESFVNDAVEKGATILTGGKKHQLEGNYFEPTLIKNISSSMRIANEEIFGPIAAVQVFDTEDEVISKANDTEYGLAAYFFTRDIGRVIRLSEELEYGIVCSNSGVFSTEVAPFGGWKESGIGAEGGQDGIAEFYETKFHSMGGI